MMDQLFKKLQQLKVGINEVDGRLDIQAPKGVLNSDLLKEIKDNKEAIIEFVKKYKRQEFTAAIPNAPQQEKYVLSSSQKRMWIVSQFAEANTAYVIPGTFIMDGRLDRAALEKSFHSLLERHDILRSVFLQDEQGEVWQYVKSVTDAEFVMHYHDLREAANKEADVKKLIEKNAEARFDLAKGPLLKAFVCQIEDNKWIFNCIMHHIIGDGWSMSVLIRDLILLYNGFVSNLKNTLAPLVIQYKDYATWQQAELRHGLLQGQKEYWLQQLSGELPVMELPADKKRPAVKTYNGDYISLTIDKELTDRLKALMQEQESSLFMGLQAIANILLYRYTGQCEMITGTPVAGREHNDLEDQVGLYINTLALRIRLQEEENYLQLLQRVKQVMLGAYQHQSYPFDELVNALGMERNVSRNPLFDVMVALQNADIHNSLSDFRMQDVEISEYKGNKQVISKFDLTFAFVETGEGLHMGIEYNSDLFTANTAVRMGAHFVQLLKRVVSNPLQQMGRLDFLSTEERHALLFEFNNTQSNYPFNRTITDLFEEQVINTGDAVALLFKGEQLSYRGLNQKANQLAHYLIEKGVKRHDVVGLLANRGFDMVISIMAILKCGAVYIPLSKDYPPERLNYFARNAGASVIVYTSSDLLMYFDQNQEYDYRFINAEEAGDFSNENLNIETNAEDGVYIMYTSGTTGNPKGILVNHRNIIKLVFEPGEIAINADDKVLQWSNFSFDGSTYDIFSTLLKGAGLYLIHESEAADVYKLGNLIHEQQITVSFFTTALFNSMVEYNCEMLKGMRKVLMGGEMVSVPHVEKAFTILGEGKLIHVYGPTETTVFSTYYPVDYIDDERSIPIGRPLANTQIFILDKLKQLVAPGAVGEIYIGGDNVSLGYINNDAFTAEKFMQIEGVGNGRLYKTGDLGKLDVYGNIEYIGRIDDQVKIRGYRIEPAEIEAVLNTYEDIEKAVVLVKSGGDRDKTLVAYLVTKEKPDVMAVRNYLKRRLPDYMVPSQFVQLDILPLTSNGKIDKRKLLSIDDILINNELDYIPPSNETEEKLLSLWSELLKRNKETISVTDNFFDLGGDSLKIIQLSMLIGNVFGKELRLPLLFQYPNISTLAGFINSYDVNTDNDSMGKNEDSPIVPIVSENQEIAIIGISCEYPESGNYTEYWNNIRDAKYLIKRFTDEELIASGVPESTVNDSNYVRAAGILNNKEYFDYPFFDYLFEEASLMDPQIRIFHMHAWQALEDAGYASHPENTRIGLFCGAGENSNWRIYAYQMAKKYPIDSFYLDRISNKDFISTLISYKLNLRGPSYYINTACSTSLTAVHLARQSLLAGECNMALAGGVTINTLKEKGFFYRQDMILSQDGYCRAFDANANGTCISEGVGIVLLKRLDDAVRDGDHIHAVIKSSAVNNDGNNKVGYTAPGIDGQAECIFVAHRLAGVDPESIGYVEAHGTGTRLGDPIEISALKKAFGLNGSKKTCAIGSVKTNMGHTDAAAGVAGLIKATLSLKHKQIPPSLHFMEANPDIDFDKGPFYVNTELREWERKNKMPLRAGVSAFGIGGTNVHVVLEEAPQQEAGSEGREYKLLNISAKSEAALQRYADDLLNYLQKQPGVNLADLAYSLQVGRRSFAFRKSIVFQHGKDLMEAVRSENVNVGIMNTTTKKNNVVFMFPGQGSQYQNMGKDLYDKEFVFRTEMDKGFHIIKKITGKDFKEIIFPLAGELKQIDVTLYTQPIIFLFDYCLARLMMSWGVIPSYMIGHSLGEYVAACISGVISFEDALKLIVKRSELMNSIAAGQMLSAYVSEKQAIEEFLCDGLAIAAVNSPQSVVFSGENEKIEELAILFTEKKIPNLKLPVSLAAHSPIIDLILDNYRDELKQIQFNEPAIPFVSNVTGQLVTKEQVMSIEYWVKQMREKVKFSQGIQFLSSLQKDFVFIEIGAGHQLTTLLGQHQQKAMRKLPAVNLVRHAKEPGDDVKYLTERLGQLWAMNIQIDWSLYYSGEERKRISLPPYSFERIKLATEVSISAGEYDFSNKDNSDLSQELKNWIYYPVWKRSVLCGTAMKSEAKTYLHFLSPGEFGSAVSAGLNGNHNQVIEVKPGDFFLKQSENEYVIDPAVPAHVDMLFEVLSKDNISITDIIYSWGIGVDPSLFVWKHKNREINLAYFSLANIMKQFSAHGQVKKRRIIILTDCLYKVTGNEETAYGQSLMLGLMNSCTQEQALYCCNIDVNLNEHVFPAGLLSEIETNYKDRVIALRYGNRWQQEYQRHSAGLINENSVLKKGGVYLITGGLGNVGFILAEYLITKYQATIILSGRKKEDRIAVEKESADVFMDRLRYLKSLSASLIYFSIDVANREDLENMVCHVEKQISRIDGVIHTAGFTDSSGFEFINELTIDRTRQIFSPKVQGIENMYTIFRDRKPDFVWVTSSLAAVLGGLGFAAYSSSNLYMDHFLTSRSAELPNWKCINLSEMLFDEKTILKERSERRTALKPAELALLFEWSVSIKGHPVILETVTDLNARLQRAYKPEHLLEMAPATEKIKLKRPGASVDYIQPTNNTEKVLAGIMEDFFSLEKIGITDDFFDLGGDSLKAMVLIQRINKEFDMNLALKDFFTNRNIKNMAAEIDNITFLLEKKERQSKLIV